VHIFRSITRGKVGTDDTILFWKDFWTNDGLLCNALPGLFSYSINEDISVADMALAPKLFDCFVLPISVQANSELADLKRIMQEI
jgi:hypothetical protein